MPNLENRLRKLEGNKTEPCGPLVIALEGIGPDGESDIDQAWVLLYGCERWETIYRREDESQDDFLNRCDELAMSDNSGQIPPRADAG